jgi:hypothetical protein
MLQAHSADAGTFAITSSFHPGGDGRRQWGWPMAAKYAAKYLALIGLSAGFLALSQTVTPAQTVNPSSTLLLPEQAESPISAATPGTGPGTLSNETTGTNPLTGLPCTGEGSLAESGAGALPDASNPAEGTITPADQGAISLPSLNSVFGPTSALGAC